MMRGVLSSLCMFNSHKYVKILMSVLLTKLRACIESNLRWIVISNNTIQSGSDMWQGRTVGLAVCDSHFV